MSLTFHTDIAGPARKPAGPTWLLSSLLALVLALSVIMLLSQVWRAGMASAYFFQVQHLLTKWDTNSDQFTEQGYQQADLLMQRTLALEPDHPHYLLTMAKIQEWGWFKGFKPASSMDGVEAYYQKGLENIEPLDVAVVDALSDIGSKGLSEALEAQESQVAPTVRVGRK